MKITTALLLTLLPAWAAAQTFQALPETSDTIAKLNSLHACSYHQILPKQAMSKLTPEQLGPVIGVSVDTMEGKVFKLGKYFRPKENVVFYADDEVFNVAASTNKSGLERARADSGVLLTQFERSLSATPTNEEDMMFALYQVSLQQQGNITHQQKLIRMCLR